MTKLTKGTRVEFTYHGRTRVGTVETVASKYVTIKHDDAKLYDDKTYSSYYFTKMTSPIRVLA